MQMWCGYSYMPPPGDRAPVEAQSFRLSWWKTRGATVGNLLMKHSNFFFAGVLG